DNHHNTPTWIAQDNVHSISSYIVTVACYLVRSCHRGGWGSCATLRPGGGAVGRRREHWSRSRGNPSEYSAHYFRPATLGYHRRDQPARPDAGAGPPVPGRDALHACLLPQPRLLADAGQNHHRAVPVAPRVLDDRRQAAGGRADGRRSLFRQRLPHLLDRQGPLPAAGVAARQLVAGSPADVA